MSEKRDRIRHLEAEARRSRRVVEASYALHATRDLDELLALILEAARQGVDAERGTVFLLSEDGREIWSRVVAGEEDVEIRLPVGQGIAGSVASTGESVRLADPRADPRFDPSWDQQTGFTTRNLLTAPIRSRRGRVVGVFQLLNRRSGGFEKDDEAFLEALSVHAALALENVRLHRAALEKERQDREIQIVQHVQRAYQPERWDVEHGCLRAAGMNELCEDASGDYYDFLVLPEGRLGIAVGDVAGHGLGAALVMAQARAFLRAFATALDDLPGVMDRMNDLLAEDMTEGRFMTLFAAVVDPTSGSLRWCSAGHPDALLWRAGEGRIERLGSQGRMLGVFPGAGYPTPDPVRLEVGDVLLLYTDGATEARAPGGEMFAEAGLERLLGRLADRDPAALLDGIREGLVAWVGGQGLRDDLTLLALTRVQSPGGAGAS